MRIRRPLTYRLSVRKAEERVWRGKDTAAERLRLGRAVTIWNAEQEEAIQAGLTGKRAERRWNLSDRDLRRADASRVLLMTVMHALIRQNDKYDVNWCAVTGVERRCEPEAAIKPR